MDENELRGGSETILIVDDHETIWDFLIDVLQKLGYCVLLAETAWMPWKFTAATRRKSTSCCWI